MLMPSDRVDTARAVRFTDVLARDDPSIVIAPESNDYDATQRQ